MNSRSYGRTCCRNTGVTHVVLRVMPMGMVLPRAVVCVVQELVGKGQQMVIPGGTYYSARPHYITHLKWCHRLIEEHNLAP